MKNKPLVQVLKGHFHCEKLPFDLFLHGINGGPIYTAGGKLHGTIIGHHGAKNYLSQWLLHNCGPIVCLINPARFSLPVHDAGARKSAGANRICSILKSNK